MFSRSLFISLSPNVEKDDIWLALKLIFQPWKWKRGTAIESLEEKFRDYLGAKQSLAFNSGRSALLAIIDTLELQKGDEVLLQAFTCSAAVNPIIWSGLKPIFIDIKKETLNINPQNLEKRITAKSRVVIVQHTFGLPAEMDKIVEICQKNNLILIEDCAHSLGATYNGKKVGSFGKASFFSLGRDKIISSVYGGVAITNDDLLGKKIKKFQNECKKSSSCWILQQLWHPILTKLISMPLYSFFGLGKYALVAFQKLGFISKAICKKEKQGERPLYLPQRMPNALALLGLKQFKKLERFNQHRVKIAEIYNNGVAFPDTDKSKAVYMRYPVLIDKYETDEIIKFFRKKNIFLDDGWRKSAVVPKNTNQAKMGYQVGSCPIAEEIANKRR
jgi:dTDP-4-amino-4,6-dideoxygalactose transaminase